MGKSSKQKKMQANVKRAIVEFMKGRRYRPMSASELQKRLQFSAEIKPLFQEIVQNLTKQGEIIVRNKKLSLKKEQEETVITGTLRVHHKGFAFLIPDSTTLSSQDIFIPKHLTDNGVDGDHVEVALNPESNWEKGPEGRVLSVLKRAHKHLAGTIKQISSSGDIFIYVPLLGSSKTVIAQSTDNSYRVGDRVVLKVLEWGREQDPTIAAVSHVIGNISDPSIDVDAAVEEFDIHRGFTNAALQLAKSYGKKVLAKDVKNREDFTALECITIDPDTAKDFDDALSLTKDRKGNYHLGVHIADVAHYVKAQSPLDTEAYLRCNSTYFPGTCVPMLPEELSNELCSLKPAVDRLVVSVMMDFDKKGNLLKHAIFRSCIHSKKRFTYGEAKEVLDGVKKSPHKKLLQHMVELCLLLKQKRYERGSIDFALPEIVIEIDAKGVPTGMKKIEYDITHQLVEEFMLKANEIVATDLTAREKSLLYRVHEAPLEENFKDFVAFANSLGFKLSSKPSTEELRDLFEQAKKTPFSQQISIAFIRSMKLAQYSPENVGHFGLSLENYCHFTSPIRRYSDLIIQRLLFDEEPKDLDLEKIAERCSEQERLSFKAESSVKTLKKLRLLKHYFEDDPEREFPAVVTRVKPFGLHFELSELSLEGFLHISELENDYFTYDAKCSLLVGSRTGKTHRLGETLLVRIADVNLILLESHWSLVTPHARKPSFSKRKR